MAIWLKDILMRNHAIIEVKSIFVALPTENINFYTKWIEPMLDMKKPLEEIADELQSCILIYTAI